MAELATIARPYAEASFRSALEARDLAGWSDGLALAGAIAADPQMADVLGNPRFTRAQKLELFFGVGGDGLPAQVRNLVTILVDGARAVLRAAALTYVAGFVASLGQLVYFFLISRD